MANKFPVYPEAMTLADIKKGMDIWHVYELINQKTPARYRVVDDPKPYRKHKHFQPVSSSMGDDIVFDVAIYMDDGNVNVNNVNLRFASDCNTPPNTYNDNYIFDTYEKAMGYIAWRDAHYAANPQLRGELQHILNSRLFEDDGAHRDPVDEIDDFDI